MNDFTKEELEDIENGLGWLCEHNPFHTVEIGKLMNKVKYMIENYCEHEVAVWPLYTATGDMACAGLCFTCNKCVDKEFINE
jgi:hypothetical protein